MLLAFACACGGDAVGPYTAAVPASMVVSGQDQSAGGGFAVPERIEVTVRDEEGARMASVPVRFAVSAGGGWISAAEAVTASDGRATIAWYLGRAPGTNALRITVAGLSSVTVNATGTPLETGQSYFGDGAYIEYVAGDLPLVVSAPHGGYLRPAEMPERTQGTVVQDRYTQELARAIGDAFAARLGGRPHVVISRIHRVHLDPNREIGEAAQGNPAAELAWREFQTFIEDASMRVRQAHGEGFYIDLHGHGHEIQRLELGYMLSGAQLSATDQTLDGGNFAAASSVREIAERTGRPLSELLRGPASLGALLAARDYRSFPSPADPHPAGAPYFSGGYNTGRHGSRDGGTVSGVQLECNYVGVRDEEEARRAFADALVGALESFFATWMSVPLAAPAGAGAA
jgi:N-formylglutamate amidohydrolase